MVSCDDDDIRVELEQLGQSAIDFLDGTSLGGKIAVLSSGICGLKVDEEEKSVRKCTLLK